MPVCLFRSSNFSICIILRIFLSPKERLRLMENHGEPGYVTQDRTAYVLHAVQFPADADTFLFATASSR